MVALVVELPSEFSESTSTSYKTVDFFAYLDLRTPSSTSTLDKNLR
jgi:hypothetical protein